MNHYDDGMHGGRDRVKWSVNHCDDGMHGDRDRVWSVNHCDDGMHGDRDRVWSVIIVMMVCMVIETEFGR